jgi:hypothetical protein
MRIISDPSGCASFQTTLIHGAEDLDEPQGMADAPG